MSVLLPTAVCSTVVDITSVSAAADAVAATVVVGALALRQFRRVGSTDATASCHICC